MNSLHLKGSIIHWIEGNKYCQYDISANEPIGPIELPVEGDLVSIRDNEIEVVETSREWRDFPYFIASVYLISMDGMRIIDRTLIEHRVEPGRKSSLQMHGTLCMRLPNPVEIIPLSKYGIHHRIEPQRGYKFFEVLWNKDHFVSLWTICWIKGVWLTQELKQYILNPILSYYRVICSCSQPEE